MKAHGWRRQVLGLLGLPVRGNRKHEVAFPLVVAVLIFVSCGGTEGTSLGASTSQTRSPAGSTDPVVKIVVPEPPGPGESLLTVRPAQARHMTIADVLRQDERFTVFRQLAEHTQTSAPGRPSWLELWDWPASKLGDDHDGYTVFAPTDEAFARLEPVLREALAEGRLINAERYWLLGYHGVHRLFPSSEFGNGSAGSWEGDVQMTLDPLTYGGQPILQTDLRVANGIIHVIDGVVVPDLVLQAAIR
jgi:uncharacterized surface protein with fasciclin (FAS1) repeats